MAVTTRAAISATGPGGGTGWQDFGRSQRIVAATATSSPVQYLAQIVPFADPGLAGGASAPDYLPSGTAIMRVTGAEVALLTTLTAQIHLTLTLDIYRATTHVGGSAAFGWTAGSTAGTPALAGLTTVKMPAITANTAMTTVGGYSYVPVQPGDILLWTIGTDSSTVAVPDLVATAQLV